MYRIFFTVFFAVFFLQQIDGFALARPIETITDSLKIKQIEEVEILGQDQFSKRATKPLALLDEYLQKAGSVQMIRRGHYAREPFINGMSSERSLITIEGMRIYTACTDKMDPITSYLEITNIAKAQVENGQSGSSHGATIAGSMDLTRKKSTFGPENWKGMAFTGYESNNQQKIGGGSLAYAHPQFYVDLDLSIRDAENYRAADRKEIPYSQFSKYNLSSVAGYKIREKHHLEASILVDKALNVGYPALTMDVASADAWISALTYHVHEVSPTWSHWESKLYYNQITHIMDDSQRPDVPIRMDMPGWSKTFGWYSKLIGQIDKHHLKIQWNGHFNHSLAEMTMYSQNPDEKEMFMLTWPGVNTSFTDIYVEDALQLSPSNTLQMAAGLSWHSNLVSNTFGLESLKIFYPTMSARKNRLLKRLSAQYQFEIGSWHYQTGLEYGERAPSISEGYGFYLFNNFDQHDYIGNPHLSNEKSAAMHQQLSIVTSGFTGKISASYFYLMDYILGIRLNDLSPMTIGALGVKQYQSLRSAHMIQAQVQANILLTRELLWSNQLQYHRGTSRTIKNLPMIQPLTFQSTLAFNWHTWSADLDWKGAFEHKNINSDFGELPLDAYQILNFSASKRFDYANKSFLIKTGIENIGDRYYTTFADWNRLPNMGRNVYLNLVWNFR